MAQLIVRDIEAQVISKLRRRAKRHRRNLQEEVREILHNAVDGEAMRNGGLGTRIALRFSGRGLKPGEEIHEIRNIQLRVPNFDDDSEREPD
jgi:plasmid stability protein